MRLLLVLPNRVSWRKWTCFAALTLVEAWGKALACRSEHTARLWYKLGTQLDLLSLTSSALDSTLQHTADQSAQCFLDKHQVTAGILKLLRQNSHLDQTLVTFLWWVPVSSFYKPSWDSKRESAMPRISQPFSSRTRSGLQYFSSSVIFAACSLPFVLQSNLWGMRPCLHSIISCFFKGLNFRYPYPA